MKETNKKTRKNINESLKLTTLGFTLVELLAVIAVLGLILIIAIPKVMDTLNTQKKRTLELTTRSIIKAAEEKYLENSAYGIDEEITCESISNITSSDFESCNISFDEVGNASVTIEGKGRYDGLNVCNGTKENMVATKGECQLVCGANQILVSTIVDVIKPYEVNNVTDCSNYMYKLIKLFGGSDDDASFIAGICTGEELDGTDFNEFLLSLLDEGTVTEEELVENNVIKGVTKETCKTLKGLQCTFDGELVPGVEFTHNQYTYRYKQEYSFDFQTFSPKWTNLNQDGWGVTLTDINSTEPINTQVCSYINGKPLLSTASMFLNSKTSSIDVSDWETGNVVNMSAMFGNIKVKEIVALSTLDVSNVRNMLAMFFGSTIDTINLSNMNISKVQNITGMFWGTRTKKLNMSNINLNNIKDMGGLFNLSFVEEVDLSYAKTDSLTNMNSMFYDSGVNKVNLTGINTSNVTDMGRMFFLGPNEVIGFNTLDTSNVTNMSYLFQWSFSQDDLKNLNTSKVTSMEGMFGGCTLPVLDLSDLDLSSVTNMYGMFEMATTTVGYARTQADADKLNASSNKPDTLTFVVKPSS